MLSPLSLISTQKQAPSNHPLCSQTRARQAANREAAKAFPSSAGLLLPVVPHVGETDTDTLTEIPGRSTETEEEEDEFGYSWSEFTFWL